MRKPLEPGHKAFIHQPGLVGGKWRGMRREGHRVDIPDDQFYMLQNMRLIGGQWQSRGGQTKANASAASGTAITGLYSPDKDSGGGARVLYQRQSTPVAAAIVIGLISVGAGEDSPTSAYNPDDLSPVFQTIFPNAGDNDIIYQKYGSGLVAIQWDGSGNKLYDVSYSVEGGTGTATLSAAIATVTGRPVSNHAMAELGGNLYIASDASGGLVEEWTGAALSTDGSSLGGGDSPLLASYAGDLFFCADNLLKKRNGGSWDTITFPTSGMSAGGTFTPQSWAVYDGDLYVGGEDIAARSMFASRILKYDGSTFVHAHTTGYSNYEVDADANVPALATFNDILYFVHKNQGDSGNDPTIMRLGSFNGAAWDDTVKDWTADAVYAGLAALALYGDNLYFVSGGGGASDLYESDGVTVTNAWTKINSGDLGYNIDGIKTFLAY